MKTLLPNFRINAFVCLLISLLFITNAQGQLATGLPAAPPTTMNRCASDFLRNKIDPAQLQAFEQRIYFKAQERSGNRSSGDTTHYTIPVVFHIIHENGPENIPDADLWDAMTLLNAAFKHAPPYTPADGVDINIDFCLSTSAITRSISPLTDLVMETGNSSLKAIDQWDPNSYINIWVVSSIYSSTMGPGVAGYSSMPPAHGTSDDGIVIEAGYLNNNSADVAVLIHEMGHYLGLYHTFEGGCGNSDCLLNGDKVCDTPPDNSTAGVLCSSSANTCTSDSDDPSVNNPFRSIALGGLGDQPDMTRNFMDYGFQACQNTFTDGQRTRMRDGLLDSRHSLLEHPGLCAGCPAPIVATLTIPDTLPAGVPATFNIVTSSTGLLCIWQFNGNSVVGSNSITQTFSTAGTVVISIYVINPSSPGCSFYMYDTVYFNCAVPQPVLSASPSGLVAPGEVVTFSTPDNGFTYTWNVDGAASGSGSTFTYTAGALGQMITVSASNGTCQAISSSYFADPSNCANSKQNNTWYFGQNAGINFNVSPPQPITGSVNTLEGAAVLCDDNGLPLFHSDGTTVGNSQTGLTLLNGSGLYGNSTTTQSALFVPVPGSNRFVYLFTVDFQATEGPHGGGIYYSIIDKLGDGGQGEVTTKNQLLLAPVTEKVTAVKNMSGDGIWLLAHKYGSNAFYAWLLSSSGISAPMVSNVGSIHSAPPGALAGYYAIGEMKASPNGNKIAVAIAGSNLFEVFDFNKATGILSNPVTLNPGSKTYGVAFSPNERFLYGSYILSPYKISRYDLAAGDAAAVAASAAVIGNCAGALQLAPDGKIYAAYGGQNYLGVISNPNAVNASDCNYVSNGFTLAPGTISQLGLVNPVQSTLAMVKPEIAGIDRVCMTGPGQTISYNIDPVGNANYLWTHHGPNAFTLLNDSSAIITYSSAGHDTLIVNRISSCGTLSDTLVITSGSPVAFSIGPDQTVCKGTAVTLNAGAGMFLYQWSNGANTQTTSISTAGTLTATVTTTAGCVLRDTMLLQNYTLPSLHLGNDTSICAAETVTLSAPAGMDSYLWSTGAITSSIVATDSGRYIVTVGKYGCLFKDTVRIQKNLPLNLILADTLTACQGSAATYTASGGFDSYSWQLPSGAVSATQSVTLNQEGYYILTYGNHCGTGKDTLYRVIPQIFTQDTIFSCADTIELIANFPLTNFIHVNDIVGFVLSVDSLTVFNSGIYFGVANYAAGGPGCYITQVLDIHLDTAAVRPPLSIDLGPDASYCEGGVLPLNAGSGFEWYHWSNGSVDSATTVYGFGEYTVTAHYCGFDYSDTIVISNNNAATVNIGPDVTSCMPSSVVIDAGSGYDWYLWSNGATTQQINGTGFGEYSVSAGMNGCVARDTMMIIDCTTAIPEKTTDCAQPFYLSPNPGSNLVTIGSRCPGINNVRVSVSASNGKRIAEKEGGLNTVNVFMNRLMQELSSAVYIVRIDNGNEPYYFKWMIIK